ncbi:MAG: DMT family transporter [Patescibacteria group bacterium]
MIPNWLAIAVAAQIILGSSAVFDKLLLKRRFIEPWGYTFWFGLLGVCAALLLPFGFEAVPFETIFLGLIGGIAFVAAAFFHFWALERVEASETLPLVGAISPVFTLMFGWLFLAAGLGGFDLIGFAFLAASGLVLVVVERRFIRREAVGAILLAALLIGIYNVIAKLVFLETSFITGFFWLKMGGVLAALAMLASASARRIIWKSAEHTGTGRRVFYFANRGYAALGSLLTAGAIFLANPALVDATQNLRYVVIFILAWLLLRERFRGWILVGKVAAAVLIGFGLALLALGEYARSLPPAVPDRPITWGVTFSQKYADDLGLEWRGAYRSVLDDLQPEALRLVAYWDRVEPESDRLVFDDLDWQLDQAAERRIPVVLSVGLKVPRWPECHMAPWARELETEERESALREYLKNVAGYYRGHPAVAAWQVENEPFLAFGECPERGEQYLRREIEAVRGADPNRPIVVTDSGELGLWFRAARYGDIFGTTMYRKIHPKFIGFAVDELEYPLPPDAFRVKERFTRWVTGETEKPFWVVELQAEPWGRRPLRETPHAEQVEIFSPAYFRDTIRYAKAAGFSEYYLWGAEWWYWMKEQHGDSRYWEVAQEVFRAEAR